MFHEVVINVLFYLNFIFNTNGRLACKTTLYNGTEEVACKYFPLLFCSNIDDFSSELYIGFYFYFLHRCTLDFERNASAGVIPCLRMYVART